jgi:hypothetical protein
MMSDELLAGAGEVDEEANFCKDPQWRCQPPRQRCPRAGGPGTNPPGKIGGMSRDVTAT